LKNETIFFKKKIRLLHIAPEQSFYRIFKKLKNIKYTTYDLNSPLASIKGDICNMPFMDNSFDFLLCNHVLEHIKDDKKAMSEIYRVLNINGTAILQVPLNQNSKNTLEDNSITNKKERIEKFGQYDHVRLYGMDYFERLKKVGFEVEQIKYSSNFNKKDIKKFGIIEDEIIPLCKKLIKN